MGRQIIVQPDGLFAIYSTVTDSWLAYDYTKDEVITYFVNEAAEEMHQRMSSILQRIEDGESRRIYAQFALTFEEANANHLESEYPPVNFEHLRSGNEGLL